MIEIQIGFLLGMICGGMCVLLGWVVGYAYRIIIRKPSNRDPNPVRMGDHWNCGICGCSHKYYQGAIECDHRGMYR